MTLIKELSIQLLEGLPLSMQREILSNESFQKRIKLNGTLAPFSDAGRVLLGDLLDAARIVYETGTPQTISNLDEKLVQLFLHDQKVKIADTMSTNPADIRGLFELALIAPSQLIRREAFTAITEKFGPTGPSSDEFLSIVEDRPLTNEEVYKILQKIHHSYPHWEAITQKKISIKQLAPLDLIPNNPEYYEALCGPFPNETKAIDYFRGPLRNHYFNLVKQDFCAGYSLILPGSLHKEVSATAVIEKGSIEEITKIIHEFKDSSDPLILLGIIETCLFHQKLQPELGDIASSLIERLCSDRLLRHDNVDIYDFYPVLVKFSLNHIRRVDGIMCQPPYWHNLCAFMHASIIIRLFEDLQFDPKEISNWLNENQNFRDSIADTLALQTEPTWHSSYIDRKRIQAEIVGRLLALGGQQDKLGAPIPQRDLLLKRAQELINQGIYPFRPGPLEGWLRPIDDPVKKALPDEQVNNIITEFKATGDIPWRWLADISASMFLPETLRLFMIKHLTSMVLPEGGFADRVDLLAAAAMISLTHKDINLAEAVTDRLFMEVEKEPCSQTCFCILLLASAATDDHSLFTDWLSEKLYCLAANLPMGEPLETLSLCIKELKALLPISQWKFGAVEALCSTP